MYGMPVVRIDLNDKGAFAPRLTLIEVAKEALCSLALLFLLFYPPFEPTMPMK